MPKHGKVKVMPFLVVAIDLTWYWLLATHWRPRFLQMLAMPEPQATMVVDNVIEPRLWLGYAIVLGTQLTWVTLIAPRAWGERRLRLTWWLGCMLVIISSVVLRQGLALPPGPELVLIGVQIGDLLLLYWLSTRLLTPLPQRRVIPGWW
jgi:hypothetical protein